MSITSSSRFTKSDRVMQLHIVVNLGDGLRYFEMMNCGNIISPAKRSRLRFL